MKRGLYKTEAVVLNSFDYGESDRILSFYTSEFGKLKGIAKGARRSRRRFVGKLDPGCRITLIFFLSGKSELVRVEDASLIDGFSEFKNDVELFSMAHYILELTAEMTREGQVVDGVYPLLTSFLGLLAVGEDPRALLRFFEMKLLSHTGYLPHLDGCVVCRARIKGGRHNSAPGAPEMGGSGLYFSSGLGGVVCGECRSEGKAMAGGALINVSPGTVGLLSMATRLEPEKLTRLKAAPTCVAEGERLLDDFIRHQIGKELKTKTFLQKLKTTFT